MRAVIAGVALAIGAFGGLSKAAPPAEPRFLTGQLLVAKPGMADPRFRQTVIFMVKHDDSGAFGLIVNKKLGPLPFAELLTNMRADPDGVEGNVMVHYSGPVEPLRGFKPRRRAAPCSRKLYGARANVTGVAPSTTV